LGIPADDPPTSPVAPSCEESGQIAYLQSVVVEQAKLIEKMGIEIVELRARLGMNSRNSSKPPSSDGYVKPAPKSRRTRSGKKPGKQPGDPGHHLAQRLDPDVTVTHSPTSCERCGQGLEGAPPSGVITRQVFDLPAVSLTCTEHRALRKRCACGAETTAAFPKEATAPAAYGPSLRAYVAYLVTRQHIPVARVAELLRDSYEAEVSTGAIVAMVQEGAAMLAGFLEEVRCRLRDEDVVHADETGLRVEARLRWVHAVSSGELTYFELNARRGLRAMEDIGVFGHLSGVLVHDGWGAYRIYDNVTHALCNAHHLRELASAAETAGQDWASDMAALLVATWDQVQGAKAAGRSALSRTQLAKIRADYAEVIAAGHRANPPVRATNTAGRTAKSKAHNLLLRLETHADAVLCFASDFAVPFDNNLCERDIRMVKIAQKISGGFRSTQGAEAFLAFRSYLSTAAKQGVNRLGALQQLFDQNPWMPAPARAGP
jgi:transposase